MDIFTRTPARFLLVLAMCLAQLPLAVAEAQGANDEEARVHFRLGTAYYESGRFPEAAREYQQAYDLSRRPALLYNIFLAWRDASELAPAIEALRSFLELGSPSAEDGVRLRSQLEGMERQQREREAALAATATTTTTTSTTTEPDTDDPETGSPEAQTTTNDDTTNDDTSTGVDYSEDDAMTDDTGGGGVGLLPILVMAGGGALVVGGVITGIMALGAQSELGDLCDSEGACPPGFEDTRDRGQTLATVTDVLLIGGLVTVGVGVVLLALGVGSSDEEETSVSFGCTAEGCMGSGRVRF
jgi:hypothetical protein